MLSGLPGTSSKKEEKKRSLQKPAELMTEDAESRDLYDEYLRSKLMEHIAAKKYEETKQQVISQLLAITNNVKLEQDANYELELRKLQLDHLNSLQKIVDDTSLELGKLFGT